MESNAELPPELIFDILLRLPVKSLLRFMCVSKSWYSSISSPQFIKSHLKSSNAANRKLIFSTFLPIPSMDCSLTECDFNSALHAPMTEATNLAYPNSAPMPQDNKIENPPPEKAVEIIGSCNGLVCLATDQLRTNLFIWNPSIRRYKKLPHWGLEFKFSNLKSYGFGFDELHDDYKVVAIIAYQMSWDHNVSVRCIIVYSQKTNSWNRIQDSENPLVPKKWNLDFNRCGTFTNGKFHWIAKTSQYRIVSFDLANETFGEIEHLPDNINGVWNSSILTTGVLGEGYLALLWQPDWQKLDVEVWIMTEYGVGESWTKLYSILYPYRAHHFRGDIRIQPLLVLERGEFLFKPGSKLVIYNPEDDSCKDLNISYNLRQVSGSLKVNMYDESLVLLDSHDG